MVCPGSVCWGWVESRRWTNCNLGHHHGLDDVDDNHGLGDVDDNHGLGVDDDDDGVGGHDDVVGDDNQDRLLTKFHMAFIKMMIKMLKESKS